MKIIVLGSKHDDDYYLYNPKNLLKVFNLRDENGYYDYEPDDHTREAKLYRQAIAGSAEAAEKFLRMRVGGEYEEFKIVEVEK